MSLVITYRHHSSRNYFDGDLIWIFFEWCSQQSLPTRFIYFRCSIGRPLKRQGSHVVSARVIRRGRDWWSFVLKNNKAVKEVHVHLSLLKIRSYSLTHGGQESTQSHKSLQTGLLTKNQLQTEDWPQIRVHILFRDFHRQASKRLHALIWPTKFARRINC